MKVYRDLENLPVFHRPFITIGTFDGVHIGHQKLLKQLVAGAKAVGGCSVVITFFPHPRTVIASEKNKIFYLTTQEEKYEHLADSGLDYIVEVPFTESFSALSAEDFIKNFLVKKFSPHTIMIGYDHRFGKGREGNFKLLEKEGEKYGYHVREIEEQLAQDIIISSTKIRDALLDGDPETANLYLGYNYSFTGTIVIGNRLGRTIGFPTANIDITNKEKLIPGNGVYAVDVLLHGETTVFKGMMNIGMRPTVNGSKRTTEVNIFDFDRDIYGMQMTVILKAKLRDEKKFNNLDELKSQLALDKIYCQNANP